MYLAVVFGAALAKLYGKLKTRKRMLVFCLPEYFVTACAVGFILLSMSRTAFLTTVVTAAAIVAVTAVAYHKGAVRILAELGMLIAVCLVSFPMVFTAVRMVPAVVNDPVRYEIEFQDRSFMIYEGDPVDSDKYMTVRRFLPPCLAGSRPRGAGRRRQETADSQEGRPGCLPMQEISWQDWNGAVFRKGRKNLATQNKQSSQIFQMEGLKFCGLHQCDSIWGHLKMGPEDPKGDEYAHAHNSYLQVAYNF